MRRRLEELLNGMLRRKGRVTDVEGIGSNELGQQNGSDDQVHASAESLRKWKDVWDEIVESWDARGK